MLDQKFNCNQSSFNTIQRHSKSPNIPLGVQNKCNMEMSYTTFSEALHLRDTALSYFVD